MASEMTSRQRVRTALSHEEPDRVPAFELAFSTKLASGVLGRQAFFPRSGGLNLRKILQANAAGLVERRRIVREGTETQVELYKKLGYDAMYLIPTEFLQPVLGTYGLFGSNYMFDVSFEEIKPNQWKLTSKEGFWSIVAYDENSDTFFCTDDCISRGGTAEFERYVGVLESNSKEINEYTRDALESISIAVDLAKSNDLFIFGHGDLCHPNDQAYLTVFLEAMVLQPELADRFFAATTAGILPLVKAQLDMGVDGILGATDWCFKTGPLISPDMFRRFMVPHLKAIVDLAHSYGRPFVKHLDGNTESILPMLVNEVGIDGYHSIEPTAGMDIYKLKELYGKQIALLGNVDCGDVLTNGTPNQIRDNVRELMGRVAPGGGYIMASSNAIHDEISMENLRAMLDAGREYGVYPISCGGSV